MKSISEMNRLELASFVSTKLQESGISVVLSGGSCVSIYSEDKYVSMDLDFIETGLSSRAEVTMCMESLGFVVDHRYFRHPEAELLVEFPAGPLGIGNQPITQFNEISTTVGVLRLLTPTDCVKDRFIIQAILSALNRLIWLFENMLSILMRLPAGLPGRVRRRSSRN